MSAGNATSAIATATGAHIEALNLAGVSFAARRLLGKDPAAVTGQFTMWARSGTPGLPSLTDPLWKALAPLGAGRPSSSNAAVCDMVLVGREPDAGTARQAAADGAAEGKTLFGRAPLPDDADAQALASAIKGYWRALAGVYDEVRTPVAAGDQQAAIEAMRPHAPVLRQQLKSVKRAVGQIAERSQPGTAVPPDPYQVVITTEQDAADGAAPQVTDATQQMDPAEVTTDGWQPAVAGGEMDTAGTPVRTAVEPVPSGSLKLTDQEAEAFARREALRAEEEAPVPVRKVEVLSSKPVRNHPFLPIIFLVVVSGVAMAVLFSIINDPSNPLLQ